MYARLSSVMFPIAALLFAGAIFWGYQEHQEKNSILIKAENQYQRAFHDLNTHMDRLYDEMGETLAVAGNSQAMQRKGLVNIWRLTSQAQNEINQLPLAMLPFNNASKFLARINNFAYQTAVRDLTKQPLTDQELKMMKSLYTTAQSINSELGSVQEAVMKDHLRWMDVEIAMASENGPNDNMIIDGFKSMDKQMGEYPETEWGPTALSTDRMRSSKGLEGKEVTEDEIRNVAAQYLHANVAQKKISVEATGEKTELPTYSVTVEEAKHEAVQMDFTRKGGHLLWMMNSRVVKDRTINFDTARNKASQYLVRHKYMEMTPVTYDEYDHVAVFTFVRLIDGIRFYPDKLTVRVALDNGEVVGLQTSDHVFAPKLLTPGKPKVSKAEAQKVLNTNFRIEQHLLSVMENPMQQLVLCHEFIGKINNRKYRIFVNAETGIEEDVVEIPDSAKPIY
ncbi:MAG: germination protein YpeB [Candidatus Cohnella colombiensis]|uniref:Germination protein YpeB n=1 Tax=Candidatus Cohnella colombiensis TaxID=3121368 RepID=A0AA95EY55_9BACL|nr:MAG: germination protein YpeB [Cohnella sp.]